MTATVTKRKTADDNDLLRNGTLPTDPFAGEIVSAPSSDAPPRALPPWPVAVLPPRARRCVEAFAAATQAPVEFAAQPAVAVAAAAVGPGWRVGPPQFTRAAALWPALVAFSGQAKTPTARETRLPLLKADILLREEWEMEHAAWEQRVAAAKKRRGFSEAPGPEPQRRPLLVTDTTPESLAGDLQKAAGYGLLLHSDELASMLEGMDAYSGNGSKKGRKFYLSVWSEEEVRVSRRTSAPIEVDRPSLVVYGGVQQAVLSKLQLQDGDGLCARFCWAVAPAKAHGLGVEVPDHERQAWGEIVHLLLGAGDGEGQRFEAAAVKFLDRHVQATTRRACELETAGLGLLAAMHGKASDHLVRAAALLHALDAAEEALETGRALRRRPVPLATVERAAVLVDYYLAHGRRVVELVLRRDDDENEGRAMSEADETAAALAQLVLPGQRVEATPAEWVRRLAMAGHQIEGRNERSQATKMGLALKRLAADPIDPVRVRELPRGGGNDGRGRTWEVTRAPV